MGLGYTECFINGVNDTDGVYDCGALNNLTAKAMELISGLMDFLISNLEVIIIGIIILILISFILKKL